MNGNNNEISDKFTIPLLISGGRNIKEENIFAIINDEVLFKKPGWDVHFYRNWNFNSMFWLYTHFREIIPEECREHFEDDPELDYFREKWEENEIQQKPNIFCLLDVNGSKSHHIQYSLEINRNKELPIQMKNWTQFVIETNRQGNIILIEEVIQLDYCLEMTPQQAFLLFANNYIAHYGNLHNVEYGYYLWEIKEEKILTGYFIKGYLSWLRRELDAGVIKPLEVLQHNGYNTLSLLLKQSAVHEFVCEIFRKLQQYNTIPKNELLLYYSFYQKIKDKEYTKMLIQQVKQSNKTDKKEILSSKDCAEIDTLIENLCNDQEESLELIQ